MKESNIEIFKHLKKNSIFNEDDTYTIKVPLQDQQTIIINGVVQNKEPRYLELKVKYIGITTVSNIDDSNMTEYYSFNIYKDDIFIKTVYATDYNELQKNILI